VYIKGTPHRHDDIVIFGFRVHLVIRLNQNRDDNNMLVKPVKLSGLSCRKKERSCYLRYNLPETRKHIHQKLVSSVASTRYSLWVSQMYVPSKQFQAASVYIEPIFLAK
jgi:hypothetical protein